jgi:hypothetical protein
MKKKNRNLVGGTFAALVIIGAIWAAAYFWPKPESGVDPIVIPGADFAVSLVDGERGDVIDKHDADTELWKLPEDFTDAEDWGQWEQDADVNTMDDVDYVELDVDHFVRFVMIYNVTFEIDGIDVVYYERQAEIYANSANVVESFETPNAGAAFIRLNTNTGAVIAITANITTNVNFTIVATINMTQEHAAYKSYWNYEDNALSCLKYVFTFNATCQAAEIIGSGMVRAHPTVTTLTFGFDYLGRTPVLNDFVWCDTPTAGIVIDENTPSVLQFDGVTV